MMANVMKAARAFAERPPVGKTPRDVVFTENKYQLLRFRKPKGVQRKAGARPVLLVPSLINRWYVLDLLPEQSFVGFLLERGHDVFLIDWGTPGPEDRFVGLDTYIDRYVDRCVRVATRLANSDAAHILGYCLGGTLTAIHGALHPERVASMVTLAAPIGFTDDGLLTKWMNVDAFSVDRIADAFGNIPWPIMQACFHMLKPTLVGSKLLTLLERADDADWLKVFVAIETWGGDNVSFAGNAYRKYIGDLYRGNRLVEGGLSIAGREVRLSELTCPLMVVSFANDHIAPLESTKVLLELAGSEVKVDATQKGGHVGAVIGRRAREGLWTQISDFYRKHDGAVPASARSGQKTAPAYA